MCRTKSETVWQCNSAPDGSHFNSLNTVNIFFYVAQYIYIKKKINLVREILQKSGVCVYCSYLHFARMINWFDTKTSSLKKKKKSSRVAGTTRGSNNTTKAWISAWNQSLLGQRHSCSHRRASWETLLNESTSCRATLTACIYRRSHKSQCLFQQKGTSLSLSYKTSVFQYLIYLQKKKNSWEDNVTINYGITASKKKCKM